MLLRLLAPAVKSILVDILLLASEKKRETEIAITNEK